MLVDALAALSKIHTQLTYTENFTANADSNLSLIERSVIIAKGNAIEIGISDNIPAAAEFFKSIANHFWCILQNEIQNLTISQVILINVIFFLQGY